MASELQTGSQTAVISTEHSLGTAITVDSNVVIHIDVGAMVDGDELEIRVKERARTGDTTGEAYKFVLKHKQGRSQFVSVPICIIHDGIFTLKQTAGTGRAFPWSIRQLD